eukprot:TRINITY_DN1911_c0_g3_i2.p1 TRINITY_DN1911_c0_g3~~TRINITY_DN1911_c0_g3_i2.p1  ORF type:complete len:3679 (-),score=783.02 TRINITY_DN1911_c0_g3_i2:52-10641(-)
MVVCLSALRTNKKDYLFSTLLSIGCSPERMATAIHVQLQQAQHVKTAAELFEILSECLTKYFNVDKLTAQFEGNLPATECDQNPLCHADSHHYRLVRVISEQNIEEVVCGAHILLHHRLPSPIEGLFCDAHTTETDVNDFIDRWALFNKTDVGTNVTFWLVGIEYLSYHTQTSCTQRLFKLKEALPERSPRLLFALKGDETKTYISTVLLREETKLDSAACQQLTGLIKLITESFRNIVVVHSTGCGDGKTTSVIRTLVCGKTDSSGREVVHAQFSIDTTPMSVVLKRLLDARPITSDLGVVLHLNVGHKVNPHDANLFLCQYLLISSWRDSAGFTFPRQERDIVVIELCNTSEKDERDRIPVCKYFRELSLLPGISHINLLPEPTLSPIFYTWRSDTKFELGTKMLIATYRAMQSGARALCLRSEIHQVDVDVVNEEELLAIVTSVVCENICKSGHLMTVRGTHCCESGQRLCGKCKAAIGTEAHAVCKKCDLAWCQACMRRPPVPPVRETLYLRRFFWIVVSQFQDFLYAFDQWDFALLEDGQLFLKLAYHFARMMICCSKNLAKPAMEPYNASAPLDDVVRCDRMEKFENWRDMPFFLVTRSGYHISSTAKFSPLRHILDNEQSAASANIEPSHFLEWIHQNESLLKPVDRGQLQQLCLQLSQQVFSVDQSNPPLMLLLEVIGCFEGARPVLDCLDKLRSVEGTSRLQDKQGDLASAVSYLDSVGIPVEWSMTCTEFKAICANHLKSLFGDPAQKPAYTLTADNILRIMAVQMRLFAGIPVVIMGETGCGKTETLHFLSKVSGKGFHVINVQEGMREDDFYLAIQPIIAEAESSGGQTVVLLDEVNSTAALWTAKDMLCDHICFGVRIPANIVFVAILNPWKLRTAEQERAIAEMDVGGLDFLRYQQNANQAQQRAAASTRTLDTCNKLVYQVHRSPETIYSLVWDWGSSATTDTPLAELSRSLDGTLLVRDQDTVTDELLMATSMVSWLIRRLENVQELRSDFQRAGDGTQGDAFWLPFRTLLVELLLESQQFLRKDVYLGEASVVSLRDIRKACELVDLVFTQFWCQIRVRLEKENLKKPFPYFRFLTSAVHVALVNTYCLRLDSSRRLGYLIRVQVRWSIVRGWFCLHPCFMPDPPPAALSPSYDRCELYESFNEFATYVARGLDIDSGIAVNQALKENTFAVLCAVCTLSTLFIVGRPGSTKSRTLELLVRATEEHRRENSFLGLLNIVIQKHVVQCSPYTTAHHVHSNARRAALAQLTANKIHTATRRVVVLVLEEVGATLGSIHNPLMSLHSMIDHGIEVDGRRVRLPIIGVSNYRLDASKMGRGRVVYRGNPPVNDLELTARAILRGLGDSQTAAWISNFSLAFSENILRNENYTWYFGMRDFYATVSTIRTLAVPLEHFLRISQLHTAQPEINSHITHWAVLINLRGFPNPERERDLAEAMQHSFGLTKSVLAKWEWHTRHEDDPIRLCDCCCRMLLYRKALVCCAKKFAGEGTCSEEDKPIGAVMAALFKKHVKPVLHQSFCQYFDECCSSDSSLPAAEVISYSLQEHTSRHVMVFTKANAALQLLFSMRLVHKDKCTVIFPSTTAAGHTTTSELVQQMMRIKACMREGKTLILVKSRHLYESLLDALNVHYQKDHSGGSEDNLHKTVLSMAGVTQSVFVRPSFRCIVLEDQEELKSSVLPPMINRFSKTVLTYASTLSSRQRRTKTDVLQKCLVKVDGGGVANLLHFLVPGFSEESIDSAMYAFRDFDEVVERLCYCFSRKNLRRLALKLVEGLSGQAATVLVSGWQYKWKLYRCNADFKRLSEFALRGRQHLMVITEQLQLLASSLTQVFAQVFSQQDDAKVEVSTHMTILNQASSTDVHATLAALKRVPLQEGSSAISVFVLDSTSASQSVLLDSFMYAVSSEALDKRHHVVLIVVVSDFLVPSRASEQSEKRFSLLFDNSWGQVFADELIPRSVAGKLLPCSLLDQLERDVCLHEVLHPDLVRSLLLEKDNLTAVCQAVSPSAASVSAYIELVNVLLEEDSLLRQSLIGAILENTRQAEVDFAKWSGLAFQRAKYCSDSLRATYLDFLGGYLVRVLVHLLGVLARFGTLELSSKPEMASIIAGLMRSPELVPLCDVESCLNLAPLLHARATDVESSKGFFLFPKSSRENPLLPTRVSFPLSPFLVRHIFNLGDDKNTVQAFIRELQLDQLKPELLQKYFMDALCSGTALSAQRLPLLQKVVGIFHPKAFESMFQFHCTLAEHTEWLKAVLQFCMLDFAVPDVARFQGKCVNDLLLLACVDAVVPLSRVALLATVTRHASEISWQLIRAIAMIDSAESGRQQHTDDKRLLVQLYASFRNSEVQGILELCQKVPRYLKYFLFELFSDGESHEATVAQALAVLGTMLLSGGDNDEDLMCGVAFLLRRAFALFFEQPENVKLGTALTTFLAAGVQYFVLASHCAIDVIFEGVLPNLNEEAVHKLAADSRLFHFARMVLVVAILMDISVETPQRPASAYHPLLEQLLQNNKDDTREATLFVLRSLSAGGTVNISQAVVQARSERYPSMIARCEVIDEVSQAAQVVSPLAWFTDFVAASAALSEYHGAELLERYCALDCRGRTACLGAYLLDVGPQPIANFETGVFPDAVAPGNFPPKMCDVLQKLAAVAPQLKQRSAQLRQLVVSIVVGTIGGFAAFTCFARLVESILAEKEQLLQHRRAIEEMMVPRCPRCPRAFVDWDGCFAVTCQCGCSFCGHCLRDCGTDAHEHVRQHHGGYYGSIEDFRREFGAMAVTKICSYVNANPPNIKALLAAEMPRILAGNIFFVRPEHIFPADRGVHTRDMLPEVGALVEILFVGGHIWHRLTVAKSDTEPLDALLNQLQEHIQVIRRLVFPTGSDEPAYSWVHAMLWKLSELRGQANKAAVQLRVMQTMREFADPLALLSAFDQQCRQHSEGIMKQLQVSERELLRAPFDAVCSRSLLMLPRTVAHEHQFWAHIKANFETYPVLNFLADRKCALQPKKVACSLSIVRFLHKLQQCATERGVTRAVAAQEGSFHEFVRACGEPLTSAATEFKRDFVVVFQEATNWQCKQDMHVAYKNFLEGIPDDAKLECFLPQSHGLGILAMSLWSGRHGNDAGAWAGPPLAQNSLYRLIHGGDVPTVVGSPYYLTEQDLLSVDMSDIAEMVSALFTVPGYQNRFAADLPVAEALCMYGTPQLASYPYIATELPDYVYGLDGVLDLFTQVQLRLRREPIPNSGGYRDFTTLPATLISAAKELTQRVPHAADLIFSFCTAMIIQQADVNVPLGREVFDTVQHLGMPLTEEQMQGMQILHELPSALKSFHVEHLPAMMGLCWNHKVHATADHQVTDPAVIEEIDQTLKLVVETPQYHCQIPVILTALRAAGVSLFLNEITEQFGQTPLFYYLEMIPVPLIVNEGDIRDRQPFCTLARHFGYVLKKTEEVLGPHETSPLAESYVIPMTAFRQFLQTHTVEERPTTSSPQPRTVTRAATATASPAIPLRAQLPDAEIVVLSTSNCGDLEL